MRNILYNAWWKHKDANDMPGEEFKIEMDEKGSLTDLPYEMAHIRRHMWALIKMAGEHFGKIK